MFFQNVKKIYGQLKDSLDFSENVQTSVSDENTGDVTVILNIWRRNHIEEQLQALLNQTIRPKKIWVLQCGNFITLDKVKKKYPSIDFIHSTVNLKYFGRFSLAQFVDTKYIYLLDDDVIPSKEWVEHCLEKISIENCIVSSAGRIIPPNDYYPEDLKNIDKHFIGDVGTDMPSNYCKFDTFVDFGCNSWFIKSEWVKYIWSIFPYTLDTGEDIHLSAVLNVTLKIKTIVPSQVNFYVNGNLKREYGLDDKASWTKPGFIEKRAEILKFHIDNSGWRPILWDLD